MLTVVELVLRRRRSCIQLLQLLGTLAADPVRTAEPEVPQLLIGNVTGPWPAARIQAPAAPE
jgi:hypothetical protein